MQLGLLIKQSLLLNSISQNVCNNRISRCKDNTCLCKKTFCTYLITVRIKEIERKHLITFGDCVINRFCDNKLWDCNFLANYLNIAMFWRPSIYFQDFCSLVGYLYQYLNTVHWSLFSIVLPPHVRLCSRSRCSCSA